MFTVATTLSQRAPIPRPGAASFQLIDQLLCRRVTIRIDLVLARQIVNAPGAPPLLLASGSKGFGNDSR